MIPGRAWNQSKADAIILVPGSDWNASCARLRLVFPTRDPSTYRNGGNQEAEPRRV
jgi:hypothetical protein